MKLLSILKRFIPNTPTKFILLLIVVLVIGGFWFKNRSNSTQQDLNRPKYLSFAGDYVFTIPDNTVMDEYAITGMQLIYTGSLAARTLDEIYAAGGITVQPLTFLTDHSTQAFKKYVNETFMPDIKKNLSDDAKLQFIKIGGQDAAKITVKKGGAPLRFAYLKSGNHPAAVIAREETETFKRIEKSISDVEKTKLKDDVEDIKKTILNTTQLIKDQKTKELHQISTAELRSKSTELEITNAIGAIKQYTDGNITIDGGSISDGVFTAVVNFAPIDKNIKPVTGAFYLDKTEGQWKLKAMNLPSTASPKQQ